MKVLFVGGEPQTAEKVGLAARLRWPDASILVATDAENGLQVVGYQSPDVVVFQPGLGSLFMERFIQGLRVFSDAPLIVLEPEEGGGNMDEVKALELGADDYVRNSAGLINLVARLVALIRRIRRTDLSAAGRPLTCGTLTLDPATYEVFLDGKTLSLTFTEFRLLHLLLNNRGIVVTHDFLARSLWGSRVDSSALVKKYIQRLRRKLGDDPYNPQWIASVHGVGYRMLSHGVSEPKEAGVLA